MALYNNWVITKKYASAEVAAISTQNKIEFIRFIASDDKFEHGDLLSFDDSVLSTIKTKSEFPVSSVKISDSTVTVTGILNSTGNTAAYDINTLLLVCKYNGEEFLGAANTAKTPFLLPAENDEEITEYTIRPQLTLSNSDTVSTIVDPVSPATNEKLDEEVEKLQEQIDLTNAECESILDKMEDFVDKSTNQTVSGVKTFTSKIVGDISGNAESANKLKNAQKVTLTGDVLGSVTFDGTQEVGLETSLETVSQNDTESSISPEPNEAFTIIDNITIDTKGRVTGKNTKTVTLPPGYMHPDIPQNDTTSEEAPNNGSSFDVIDSVTRNRQGHVTGVNVKTVTMPTQSNILGNAETATRLKTPRKINGVDFDGTQDIEVNAANDLDIVHKSGDETITGEKTFEGKFFARTNPSDSDGLQCAYGLSPQIDEGSAPQTNSLFWTNPELKETDSGFSLALGTGGNLILGGGEAHRSILKNISSPKTIPSSLYGVSDTKGNAILAAENEVYLGAGCQENEDTQSSGEWWRFGADGSIKTPKNGTLLDSADEGLKALIVEMVYPVGSYYMSSISTNPSEILGVGTWERIKGKVIVGVDEDDGDFASAGLTGGEKTHKLTVEEMPSHTHIQDSHNHTQAPHAHPANNPTLMGQNGSSKYGEGGFSIMGTIHPRSWDTGAVTATNNPATAKNQNTGGDRGHNNLQPFQTAYIWLRIG